MQTPGGLPGVFFFVRLAPRPGAGNCAKVAA